MTRIHDHAAKLRDQSDNDYTRRLKRIFAEMETWLDRVDNEALLTRATNPDMLREAITQRTERGWWHPLHWVVMPNHLHILYVGGAVGMRKLMSDFKRWTGHRAAQILRRDDRKFWQDEWFDHWSRSADETERIAHYIRQNPVRAGLVTRPEEWPHGSWSV